MEKIRVAIAGVGNCASALVQGIEYYRTRDAASLEGLMHANVGGWLPSDIEFVAVNDISLDVPYGEVFGMVGPNGAGKTSTFKVLATLMEPTYGEVSLAGLDIMEHTEDAREILGYMPDLAPVPSDLKLWEDASRGGGIWRAHMNYALALEAAGRREEAMAQFEEAVAIDPFYVPAYVNWADLLRALGRDDEGERVLREGLEKVPDSPALHHTLGLLLHRTGRSGTALDELLIAADSDNSMPRYIYVYAIALADAGHPDRSLTFLEQAHDAAPHDTEILFSLATTYRDLGDYDSAIETAKKLAIEAPGAPPVQQLLDQLERRTPLPPQHPPVPGAPVH